MTDEEVKDYIKSLFHAYMDLQTDHWREAAIWPPGSGKIAVLPDVRPNHAGPIRWSPERKEIAGALAKAQAEFPVIARDQTADIATKSGGKYSYSYADLASVFESIRPALNKHGVAILQADVLMAKDAQRFACVCTTTFQHESGEWCESDYEVPVVDVSDARSRASGTTYARRYGVMALAGVASQEDDDDAQSARGGDHEQKGKAERPACPRCKVAALMPSQFKPGSFYCNKKAGGCGASIPAAELAPPPDESRQDENPYMPEEKVAEVTNQGKAPRGRKSPPAAPQAQAEDEPPPRAEPEGEQAPVDVEEESGPVTQFEFNGTRYVTKGFTEKQMAESFLTVTAADKIKGRGWGRKIRLELFPASAGREDLTEAQGEQWLAKLREVLPK
jgi:hypothetical protein